MWIEAGGADCGTLCRVIYGMDAVCAPVSRRAATPERTIMRITLVGSRHFGVTTLNMLRQRGVDLGFPTQT